MRVVGVLSLGGKEKYVKSNFSYVFYDTVYTVLIYSY